MSALPNGKTLDDFKVFYLSHTNDETMKEFGFANEAALYRFRKDNDIPAKQIGRQPKTFEEHLNAIDREAFIKDYAESDDILVFAAKYDLAVPMLYKILRRLGLKKHSPLSRYKNDIPKQKLVEFYIDEGNSREATAKYFNIPISALDKLLRAYGIKKEVSTLDEMAARISKEEVEEYYLSHSLTDTRRHFKEKYGLAHDSSLQTLLGFYGIDKRSDTKRRITELLAASDEAPTVSQVASKLNLNYCNTIHLIKSLGLMDKINLNPQKSNIEDDVAAFLASIGVSFERNDRTRLDGLELDLYIPEYSVGIEINGDWWHSSAYKDKNYHLDKSKLARGKGIRLIHIYEHEWEDHAVNGKIKQILKNAFGRTDRRIYARQCAIRRIQNAEAKPLNEASHLQGHRNAQITYGLFYGDELVQIMSFSKVTRDKELSKNDCWEIIRSCAKSDLAVVGGASKLLRHFIAEQRPAQVFSYCDFNKFAGTSYERLGMSMIGYTGPDMKWLLKNGAVVSRSPNRHKEMKAKAMAQIFGAGSLKYLLTVN